MNPSEIATVIRRAIKEIEAAAPTMGESEASVIGALQKLAEAFESWAS